MSTAPQSGVRSADRTQSEIFSNLSTNIKGSAGRMTRMAQQGNKVAILKLAGIIIGVVLVLYYLLSFLGGWIFGRKHGA